MTQIPLRTYHERIEQLLEESRLAEAAAHCRHILEQLPRQVDTYRLLGKVLLEQQQYAGATDIFQRVLSAIPDDFISHAGLAIACKADQLLTLAVWHMERAYEVDPYNMAIQAELRELYKERDKAAPERLMLTEGALARLHLQAGMYSQAVSEIRQLLGQDRARVDLRLLLAEALWRDGQRVEAVEICREVLEELPNCLVANAIVADVWLKTGKPAEAEPHLRRLLDLARPDASHLDRESVLGVALSAPGAPPLPASVAVDELEEVPVSLGQTEGVDWVSELERLDSEGEEPAWLGELEGEEGQPGEIEEVPDWLREIGSQEEELAALEFGPAEGEEEPAEAALPEQAAPAPAGDDLVDWLALEHGMPAEEEAADVLSWFSDEETGEPSGGVAEAERSGFTDWLEEEPVEEQYAALEEEGPAPIPSPAIAPEPEEAELPDWAPPIQEEPGMAEAELPAWLAEMPGAPPEEELSLTDLLDQVPEREVDETVYAQEALPAWLTGEEETEEAPPEAPAEPGPAEQMPAAEPAELPPQAEELPGWLVDLEEEAPEAEELSVTDLLSQLPAVEAEEAGVVDEDAAAWLAELEEEGEEAAAPGVTGLLAGLPAEEAEAAPAGWEEETTTPAAEPAQEQPAAAQEEAPLPQWLSEFAESVTEEQGGEEDEGAGAQPSPTDWLGQWEAEAPAAGSEELPEWLADFAGSAGEEAGPEPGLAEAEPGEQPVPGEGEQEAGLYAAAPEGSLLEELLALDDQVGAEAEGAAGAAQSGAGMSDLLALLSGAGSEPEAGAQPPVSAEGEMPAWEAEAPPEGAQANVLHTADLGRRLAEAAGPALTVPPTTELPQAEGEAGTGSSAAPPEGDEVGIVDHQGGEMSTWLDEVVQELAGEPEGGTSAGAGVFEATEADMMHKPDEPEEEREILPPAEPPGAESGPGDEVPDWLEMDLESEAEEDELPQWLQPPESGREDELPSWLQTQSLAQDAEEEELAGDEMAQALPAEEELASEESQLGWLDQLAAGAGEALEELPTLRWPEDELEETVAASAAPLGEGADELEEAALPWLDELAGLDEEAIASPESGEILEALGETGAEPQVLPEATDAALQLEPAELAPEAEAGATQEEGEEPLEEEAAAWLEGLAARQRGPEEEESELEEMPALEETPVDSLQEAEELAAQLPEDPEEAVAWLERLAAQQAAAPDEVPGAGESAGPATPVSPMAEEEAPVAAGALADTDLDSLELLAAQMPDEPDEAMAWLEQLAVPDEEAPAQEIPLPPPADWRAEVPDEPEAALAWLEQLALADDEDAEPEEDGATGAAGEEGAAEEPPAAEVPLAADELPAAEEPLVAEELPAEAEAEAEALAEALAEELAGTEVAAPLPDWLDLEREEGIGPADTGWLAITRTDVERWLTAEEESSVMELGETLEPAILEELARDRVELPAEEEAGPPEEAAPLPEAMEAPPLPEEELVAAPATLVEARFPEAHQALERGDLAQALAHYQALIDGGQEMPALVADLEQVTGQYRQQPLLHRLLGDAYARQGELQKALDVYRAVLDQL